MSDNNAVETKPEAEPVTPATDKPAAPAKVEQAAAPVITPPVESPAVKQDKKVTAAFIKQRQENRELKERLARATAVLPPPPAPAPPPADGRAPAVPQKENIPAPAPVQAVSSIEAESVKAIHDLAEDRELSAIPGAVIDLIDLVDNDPRLARLHNVDPVLAFREGKAILMQKYGVAPAPSVPLSATPSGGMAGGQANLDILLKEIEKFQPGTKQFTELANKITAEMKKQTSA